MEKNISHLVVAACMASMLTGCGIYTKYRQPETNTDGLFGALPEEVDTTSSLADLKWEELFTDASLRKLITRALEANTDLNVARLKVEEARASLSAAKQAYLPSAQLDLEGALSSFDGSKPTKTYSLGASASWELDFFGKLTNAKRRERAALEQSEAYRQVVQTQLIATVAESYYTLLMLDEQVAVTTETVESWKEYIRSLKALMRAGQADRATVNQAEASRLDAEASLLDLKQQVTETENTLCALLFWTPQPVARGTLGEVDFPESLSVGVPLNLLANRPDVWQAEAVLKQAFYATNQARSSFYPSVTLSGSAGWTNSGGALVTNPGACLLQAVGSLVQPLFQRGQLMANLKISKAQQEEALLQFQQTLLDAGAEVNNALSQWQTARQKTVLDREQVEHLKDALRDTELLMEHGTTNYLEVLTARQSLLVARLSLVADRNAEIKSVITLYHALGGGNN
jgi:multidrug efflux system outer membrane protein